MVSKIALEKHFLCPDFIEYWNPTVVDLPAQRRDKALSRLTDFGEMRLTAMNEAGIARAVLALAGPGVQAERDTATAVRRIARAAADLQRPVRPFSARASALAILARRFRFCCGASTAARARTLTPSSSASRRHVISRRIFS